MSRSVKLEIATNERSLPFDLMDPNDGRLEAGETSTIIAEDASLDYHGTLVRKSFDTPDVAEFFLRFSSTVSGGIVAQWLYEKLKDKEAMLKIGGENVEVDKESIQKKLEDYMDK